MPDSLITPLCTGAVIIPAKSAIVEATVARTGQGFEDKRRVGLVQLPGNHGVIPDVQLSAGAGTSAMSRQNRHHTQLRGPLKEQSPG